MEITICLPFFGLPTTHAIPPLRQTLICIEAEDLPVADAARRKITIEMYKIILQIYK